MKYSMLGDYKLNETYNEDSYEAIKRIPDKSVDCIYVDIPYRYMSGGKGHSEVAQRIEKTKQEQIDCDIYDGMDYKILDDFVRVSKKINIFLWCSRLQIFDIMDYFHKMPNLSMEILTWNKTNPTPSTNNKWLPDLEYCLYFREVGVKLNDGYELKSKWFTSPINKSDKDLFEHPTIKPLAFVKQHIAHATQPNDIVADFFLGSGTTAIACKELNRQFIGFEINKEFYGIAKNRINGITANGQASIFTMLEEQGTLTELSKER